MRQPRRSVRASSSLVAMLKACTDRKDLHAGCLIHASIVRKYTLETDVYVGSALVNMYAKCGALAQAQEVFNALPARNLVSWNALINGYTQHGRGEEALICFEQMQHDGLCPDGITLASIFKACGMIRAAEKGQEIQMRFADKKLLRNDVVMGTALVDMYGKCGLLASARQIFDELANQNVVSWTALISGYVEHGHDEDALICFNHMEQARLCPNTVTFMCILKACGSMSNLHKGQDIHAEISRLGLLGEESVGTALIDMYTKCGLFAKATEVFEVLPIQNINSWNALIAGYAQNDHGKEVLSCYKWMQHKGILPDAITFSSVLKASGNLGALAKGEEVHSQICTDGITEKDPAVNMALMEMYTKCGSPEKVQAVSRKLLEKDLLSWNAAIAGLTQFGENDMVYLLFSKVFQAGKEPDLVTFTVILTVCSHRGLIDLGQMCFEAMSMFCSLTPPLDHYACMIDLLSRAGCPDKAVAIVRDMPYSAYVAIWHILLRACQESKLEKLARVVLEHACELKEDDIGLYVSMSNIYAECSQ